MLYGMFWHVWLRLESWMLWKEVMHDCIIEKTGICVIGESGNVNAASFEQVVVWPCDFTFSTLKICNVVVFWELVEVT